MTSARTAIAMECRRLARELDNSVLLRRAHEPIPSHAEDWWDSLRTQIRRCIEGLEEPPSRHRGEAIPDVQRKAQRISLTLPPPAREALQSVAATRSLSLSATVAELATEEALRSQKHDRKDKST